MPDIYVFRASKREAQRVAASNAGRVFYPRAIGSGTIDGPGLFVVARLMLQLGQADATAQGAAQGAVQAAVASDPPDYTAIAVTAAKALGYTVPETAPDNIAFYTFDDGSGALSFVAGDPATRQSFPFGTATTASVDRYGLLVIAGLMGRLGKADEQTATSAMTAMAQLLEAQDAPGIANFAAGVMGYTYVEGKWND